MTSLETRDPSQTTDLTARKRLSRSSHALDHWHLLSLDAPTIAALWTWFLARANHVRLPLPSMVAMAVAVWLLYAGDRLMDARLLMERDLLQLEARHHFHYRHERAFIGGVVLASVLLAALLPTLPPAAIHLYLIEGSFLAGYFILIHASASAHRLPKELAVGLFFAAAVFIPTVARAPALRLPLLPPALLLSVLCSLNCLFIYAWEHPAPSSATHPATRLALRHLRTLTLVLASAASGLALLDHAASPAIAASVALATLLLLLLDQFRHAFAPTTLRAMADLALLTPLLFVPIL